MRKQQDLPDPGPGYRWATPREKFLAALLDLGTVPLAAVIGAVAGLLAFGFVTIAVPYLSTTVTELTNGGATSTNTGSLNDFPYGAQVIIVIAGAALQTLFAVTVTRLLMMAMPVRGPLRPTATEN
ncbi:hypothetical protein LIX17_25895 (plasmid) [Mycobacterium avium subsp. hominissuis]|uniref:hypothetical protein n=1 Tax=Mycobacterium avium TaxID=1764 RepID=UPI003140B1F4